MLADLVPQLSSIRFTTTKFTGETKRCFICKQDKPLTDFALCNRRGEAKVQRGCKVCLREYNRKWYREVGKQMRAQRKRDERLP